MGGLSQRIEHLFVIPQLVDYKSFRHRLQLTEDRTVETDYVAGGTLVVAPYTCIMFVNVWVVI